MGDKCLTMHQPWASLLVYGIKRVEGRSWPTDHRGRLWIHAASKIPEDETIREVENMYRQVYGIDGVEEVKFPEFYPTSVLVGCVNVVGCIKLDELVSWEALSAGVRMEGQSEFCWLCEDPQRLVVPFQMKGQQGIYIIPKKVAEPASRGLRPTLCPAGPFQVPSLGSSTSSSTLFPGDVAAHLATQEARK